MGKKSGVEFGSGVYHPVQFEPYHPRHAKTRPPPPPPAELTDGHVAGIVIGGIVMGLLVALAAWYCVIRTWCSGSEVVVVEEEAGVGAGLATRVRRKGFPAVLRMAGREVNALELQTLLPQAAAVAKHTNSALALKAREEAATRKKGFGRWRQGR